MDLSQAEDDYNRIGFANRVGFGVKPALWIIDYNHGCADLSMSSPVTACVEGLVLAAKHGCIHQTPVTSEFLRMILVAPRKYRDTSWGLNDYRPPWRDPHHW
jgi:hypothetical protein